MPVGKYFEMSLLMSHFWSQMTGYKDIFHGYNESRLKRTFFDGPLVFAITEFDCTYNILKIEFSFYCNIAMLRVKMSFVLCDIVTTERSAMKQDCVQSIVEFRTDIQKIKQKCL
jgi:hypothetical protein